MSAERRVASPSGTGGTRRPWFDHTTDVKPRLDRFRDPKGWLLDTAPWAIRRLEMSRRMRTWVPDGARYVLMRRPPWEAFDLGRKLHKEANRG